MAGPSPAFIAQLNAGLDADPFAAGAAAAGIAPPAAPPAAPAVNALYGGASTDAPPIQLPGVPAPAPPTDAPATPRAGPGPSAAPMSGPAPDAASPYLQANPGDVEFAPVNVGGSPAREVPTRGPQQNALLEQSFGYPLEAAQRIGQRSIEQAEREQAMYERQAEQAEEQQAAMTRVQARREQELSRIRNDYLQTIDRLSTFKIDRNRMWNDSSTMDKIGATILILLGAAAGGPNSMVNKVVAKKIEDDVEDQKRAYEMGLNLAKGQQTAYAMAMDQYGSEDAAYHAAMAAGQQAVAAKVAGMGAQWKGTEAKNKAESLQGEILMAADQNRAAGLKYLQPTMGANKYVMSIRGQRVPGLVSEEKAQSYTVEHGVKPAERVDEALIKGGIEQTTEAMKLRAQAAKETKKFEVQLPNGEVVSAPSGEEADKLRELTISGQRTQRLVDQARKIRSDPTFRASLEGRAKLGQIQSQLITQFGVQNKLGALSNADYDLAVAGTADLLQFGNGVEARLDRLSQEAIRERVDRVATYPGAPPKSAGKMPGSFQATGAK